MQGKRKYPNSEGQLLLEEGEYGKSSKEFDEVWYCRPPGSHMGSLREHQVIEHEDGTITVSPSILVMSSDKDRKPIEEFHGYLERGIWRKV